MELTVLLTHDPATGSFGVVVPDHPGCGSKGGGRAKRRCSSTLRRARRSRRFTSISPGSGKPIPRWRLKPRSGTLSRMPDIDAAVRDWIARGMPGARWTAVDGERLRDFRILEEEHVPDTIEVLREFDLIPPVDGIGKVRLVRATEPSGKVFGWTSFWLLGGEPSLGYGLPEQINVELDAQGASRSFGLRHSAGANAFVLPIELELDAWSVEDVRELYLQIWEERCRADEAARERVEPVFHHADDKFMASVKPARGGFRLELAFGRSVDADGDSHYVYDATRTPPKLREALKEEAIEPGLVLPLKEQLVRICEDLKAGRIDGFEVLDWERYDPAREELPRRLVVVRCPSGTVAFGVPIDFSGEAGLKEFRAAMRDRAPAPSRPPWAV